MTSLTTSRREFLLGAGAIALGAQAAGKPSDRFSALDSVFINRGGFERLNLNYGHVHIGLRQPFSILHISDTHFTEAYAHEPVAKCGKAGARTRTFGGKQILSFESSLDWAKKNVDFVLHTGDLIDFQSEANFDLVRKYLAVAPLFGSMGNHEFYSYLPDEKHTWQETFKTRSWPLLKGAYPYDARFAAQVENGVNFVCLDDVFGTVQPDQVEKFTAEVRKGIPIVLAMHVPLFTDEIWRATALYWQNRNRLFRSAQIPPPTGDYERQMSDPVTRDFVRYLKNEPLLKAVLSGHEHFYIRDRFSPTAEEFVVCANYMFAGQVILFT